MTVSSLTQTTAFALLLLSSFAVGAQTPVTTEPALEEITVTGELPGPGLWVVRNGERSLYLLGTLSPLPKDLQWRSRELERVLARAQMLIPSRGDVSADVGPLKAIGLYFRYRSLRNNPDDATLKEVLSPELFQQFETLRQKYAPRERSLLDRRPVLAAGELWREAVEDSGLSLRNQVNRRVEKLADQNDVPIVRPRLRVDDVRATLDEVAKIPVSAEIDCMQATLNRLESDLQEARQRAEAWAVGDIAALRISAVAAQQEVCWSALLTSPKMAALRREFDEAWMSTAVLALEGQETTLAVVPIFEILKPNGILTQLRARGYEVEEPN
jgi:uncharacterized protein YbaP (TraB family)